MRMKFITIEAYIAPGSPLTEIKRIFSGRLITRTENQVHIIVEGYPHDAMYFTKTP
jgi:hypothetical protein